MQKSVKVNTSCTPSPYSACMPGDWEMGDAELLRSEVMEDREEFLIALKAAQDPVYIYMYMCKCSVS